MSALHAPITPGSDSQPTVLRAVPRQSHQLAQLPFILFIAVLLGGGLTGVLVLSTTIQTQSGELAALQSQEAELRYQEILRKANEDAGKLLEEARASSDAHTQKSLQQAKDRLNDLTNRERKLAEKEE